KRRTRDLSHSDEQMHLDNLLNDTDNNVEESLELMITGEGADEVLEVLNDPTILSDRERDMIARNILGGESHDSIAASYNLSRSRVSRIIKNGLRKMREQLIPYSPEEELV